MGDFPYRSNGGANRALCGARSQDSGPHGWLGGDAQQGLDRNEPSSIAGRRAGQRLICYACRFHPQPSQNELRGTKHRSATIHVWLDDHPSRFPQIHATRVGMRRSTRDRHSPSACGNAGQAAPRLGTEASAPGIRGNDTVLVVRKRGAGAPAKRTRVERSRRRRTRGRRPPRTSGRRTRSS